jgi:superfamily II DNA helicase RecQ
MLQTLGQIAETHGIDTATVEKVLCALGIRDDKRLEPFEQSIIHGIAAPVVDDSGKTVDYRYNIEPIKEEFESELAECHRASKHTKSPFIGTFNIESTLSQMIDALNEVLETHDFQALYRLKSDIADIYAHLPKTASGSHKELFVLDAAAKERFERLRQWRNATAQQRGVPPYTVMPNAVLNAIAYYRPENEEELLSIRGIGKKRAERYADAILKLL